MPAFSQDSISALQEIAQVENALIDGYPAAVFVGNNKIPTALREASDRMGINTQALRNRIGTPERPGLLWKRFKYKVDWKLHRTVTNLEKPNKLAAEANLLAALGKIKELETEIKVLKTPPKIKDEKPEYAIDNAPPAAFLTGAKVELISLPDNTFLFGAAGDLHAASKYTRWDVRDDLYRQFIDAGCQCSFDTGNWIDGEATFNRYDIVAHGIDRQCHLLADKHPRGLKTYAVWGDDHEGWYVQREGIDVGRYAEAIMRAEGHDWTDLGFMEAHVSLKNYNSGKCASMAVVHPGGGSAYATSYTVQKIIESLEGGEKPAVGLYGHYHKLWSGLIRNVFVAQTGTQQDQTPFMRKKRLEAHVGGMLIKLRQDPRTGAIISMMPEIIRYFNEGYYPDARRWSKHNDVKMLKRKQHGL